MSSIQQFLIDFNKDTTAKDLEKAINGLQLFAEARKKRLESAKQMLIDKGNTLLRLQETVRGEEEVLEGAKSEVATLKEQFAKRKAESTKSEKEDEPSLLCDSTEMASAEVVASTPPRQSTAYFFSLDSPASTPPSLQNQTTPPSSSTATPTPQAPIHRRSRRKN